MWETTWYHERVYGSRYKEVRGHHAWRRLVNSIMYILTVPGRWRGSVPKEKLENSGLERTVSLPCNFELVVNNWSPYKDDAHISMM
jgi:hypothetical protein